MTELANHHSSRLAVYGALAPGRPNHGQLAHLPGRWFNGVVVDAHTAIGAVAAQIYVLAKRP